ncbi:MAG: mechanosensitive ion channel family protein [Candidatus Aenigmarchaeota archaeon]|nr:mechanosensitive ion channel family protein [Candidatus Aenigmarchaeota archaeon]
MFEEFLQLLVTKVMANSLQDYVISLVIFLIAFAVLRLFKFVVLKKLKSLAKRTKTDWDDLFIDVIDSIGWPFYIFVALYISFNTLVLPTVTGMIVYYLLILLGVFYVAKGIGKFLDFSTRRVVDKRKREEKDADTTVISLFNKIIKAVVWVAAFLFILSSAGIDISGALVGVGVTGIVLGFALQNVLSDLFASFSIYFDKPFKIGDFIIIGDDMGTIEKIGIKSTRINTLHGHMLVVSNRELTTARVNNYAKMLKRRVVVGLGVTYDTTTDKLKKIPGMTKKIVESTEHAEFSRCHFKEYGDFNLKIELVYFIDNKDYNIYMDAKQKINLKIKEAFEKEGIGFAYPTQTIFLNKG